MGTGGIFIFILVSFLVSADLLTPTGHITEFGQQNLDNSQGIRIFNHVLSLETTSEYITEKTNMEAQYLWRMKINLPSFVKKK